MITVVYVLISGFDSASIASSIDLYREAEGAYCEKHDLVSDCAEKFFGRGNEFAVTQNITSLRVSIIFINAIVLLFTWVNQCFIETSVLSMPWSQLAYAYIISIVWYIYIIGVSAFNNSVEQALFDSLRPAGPLAVI